MSTTADYSITEIAAALDLEPDELELYGRDAAKVGLSALDRLESAPDGKLISVTAMTPTKAGEGKTTTAISLVEALGRVGEHSLLCLREPSLGPVFAPAVRNAILDATGVALDTLPMTPDRVWRALRTAVSAAA